MRKYVVGIIIGATLAFSGQAVAGTISNVGKKIQAEYAVYVDGEVLTAKAVAADGSTFTPNRALADAVGYDIEFKNKNVYFTKKETSQVIDENGHAYNLDSLSDSIKANEEMLKYVKASIDEGFVTKDPALTETRAKIKEIEDRLADLNAKKVALEAQQ